MSQAVDTTAPKQSFPQKKPSIPPSLQRNWWQWNRKGDGLKTQSKVDQTQHRAYWSPFHDGDGTSLPLVSVYNQERCSVWFGGSYISHRLISVPENWNLTTWSLSVINLLFTFQICSELDAGIDACSGGELQEAPHHQIWLQGASTYDYHLEMLQNKEQTHCETLEKARVLSHLKD